jgi:hypothetical protein
MTLRMTRQHFRAIAETLGETMAEAKLTERQSEKMCHAFTELCNSANPNFDSYRFMEAIQCAFAQGIREHDLATILGDA